MVRIKARRPVACIQLREIAVRDKSGLDIFCCAMKGLEHSPSLPGQHILAAEIAAKTSAPPSMKSRMRLLISDHFSDSPFRAVKLHV